MLRGMPRQRASPALSSATVRPIKKTGTTLGRITTTMTPPLELEFVLLSNDYATMTAVAGGVKKYGAKFSLVPSAEVARDYVSRRKVDGIFVDTAVSGALELIEGVRKGTSNCKAVIFACILSINESTATLNAGANFLLRKPLSTDSVALHITISKELLERERRRYFRHAVNIPVTLNDGGVEQHLRMTDVSENGMAIRTVKPLKKSSMVEFKFELSFGLHISGKGLVAWTNTEGAAGISLQTFRGKGREHLEAWIEARERLGAKGGPEMSRGQGTESES